jgi:hypothetical protein
MARRLLHRLVIAGLLALGLAPAAGAQTPDKPSPHVRAAVTDYDAELARQCPAKRLDLLSPAALLDAWETFDGLPAAQKAAEQTAMEKACASANGASCDNMQMLVALHQGKHMPAFAAHVCARPETCTAQSSCAATRP